MIERGSEGTNALVCMGMGGKRKRSLFGSQYKPPPSPAGSACSTSLASDSSILEAVPRWVLDGFINALHRVTRGAETFSGKNFRQQPANCDERGSPEIAKAKEFEGTSFAVNRAPCIVAAAMDGIVSVHKKNSSFIWIAKTARVGGSSGEELVYMTCWDPDCQTRIKERRSTKHDCKMFDSCGWALLDKQNMQVIDNQHSSL